jgi:uncharacterized phage protein (TIGR02220 family)
VDWSNERYVRNYVRDTADLLAIGWEGRTVLWELMRKVDRAGVLDCAEAPVVAEMLRLPVEIIDLGLPRLIARKCVVVTVLDEQSCLWIPNFMEAQEAVMSDAQRQRECRARRRDRARVGAGELDPVTPMVTTRDKTTPVTARDSTPPAVTSLNTHSDVTSCDEPPGRLSHGVTLCLPSVPSVEESVVFPDSDFQIPDPIPKPPKTTKPPGPTKAEIRELSERVITYLNDVTGRRLRPHAPTNLKHAEKAIRAGFTMEQIIAVIDAKWAEWGDDEKMARRVCPDTLFPPTKLRRYLDNDVNTGDPVRRSKEPTPGGRKKLV